MNYLVLHYFFIACIFNRRIIGSAPTETKNYDIDDFINRLLRSQKFNELTNIVAEKAIKRLKDTNSNPGNSFINKSQNNRTQNKDKHRNSEQDEIHHEEIQIHSDIEAKNVNKDKDLPIKKAVDETIKSPNYHQQIVADYVASDEKHTEAYTNKNSGRHDSQLQADLQGFERVINSTHPKSSYESYHSKKTEEVDFLDQKREFNDPEDYMDDEFKESSDQNKSVEEYNLKLHFKNSDDTQKQRENIVRVSSTLMSHGETKDKTQNEKESRHVLKTFTYEHNVVPREKSIADDYGTEKTDKVWRGNDSQSETTDSDEEKEEDFPMDSTLMPDQSTTRKLIIRKEGDRYYTYLTAPEYADYHEELAKQQAKHKNDHFDKIN